MPFKGKGSSGTRNDECYHLLGHRQHALRVPAIAAALLAAGAGAFLVSTPGQALRASLVAGPLGSSGCLAAFSLISLSEIGDKTFFISAVLAARIGRALSFAGSLAALVLLTVVNVAIGTLCARCPDTLLSRLQLPVAELASIAVLGFFGLRAIKDGLKENKGDIRGGTQPHQQQPTAESPAAPSSFGPSPGLATGLAGAHSVVRGMNSVDMMGGRGSYRSPVAVFFEVASLIFQAEWGDRSMLATIALASSHSPVGVATGAIAGHAVATGIAVVGGAIAGKYVSERTINLISGTLFLLFAAATAFSLL
eukprot:XP_001697929.1 predicted protein [Chlamydomonas reinhardtii]